MIKSKPVESYITVNEPGDATRYNHLFILIPEDRIVWVLPYKYDWGATTKSSYKFTYDEVIEVHKKLYDMPVREAAAQVYHNEHFHKMISEAKENVYTFTNALRTSYAVLIGGDINADN